MTAALPSKTPRGERIVYVAKDLGGREPPHDVSAERAVLSAILTDHRKLDRILDVLSVERFYSDANRRIFEAILALRAIGTAVDMQTVASWLNDRDWLSSVGGVSYLADVLDATPAVAHVEAYAKIVRDKARVRALIERCQMISALGFTDYGHVEDFLSDAERDIFELTREMNDQEVFTMRELVAAEEQRLDRIAAGEHVPLGVPTGLAKLDDKLTDLRPKEITVIAGRPGQGKTSLATCIAFNVAAYKLDGVQQGVFFGSIEMPKEALTRKLASQRSRLHVQRINRGDLTDREREVVREAHMTIERLHIVVDDIAGMTPMRLRSKIRRAQAAFDLPGKRRMSVFVVDYVQRMKPDVEQKTREREVGYCMTALAEIAKETGLHGVVCAQLNRLMEQRGAAKDIRPRLSDLRDSGQIEQDAHNVIFVHRPETYKAPDDVKPEERGLAEAIIAKQREGATGDVSLKFSSYCTRFEDT